MSAKKDEKKMQAVDLLNIYPEKIGADGADAPTVTYTEKIYFNRNGQIVKREYPGYPYVTVNWDEDPPPEPLPADGLKAMLEKTLE